MTVLCKAKDLKDKVQELRSKIEGALNAKV